MFDETWGREQLSARDRSLATIAVTLSNYQTDQLRVHLNRGLDNGLTTEEIAELIAQVTLYSGFPDRRECLKNICRGTARASSPAAFSP